MGNCGANAISDQSGLLGAGATSINFLVTLELDLLDLLINREEPNRGVAGCSINSRTFSSVTDGSLGDALGDALAAALGGAIDCCIQDGVGLD